MKTLYVYKSNDYITGRSTIKLEIISETGVYWCGTLLFETVEDANNFCKVLDWGCSSGLFKLEIN